MPPLAIATPRLKLGFARSFYKPKFLFLAIAFAVIVYRHLIMSTPTAVADMQPLTFAYKTVQGSPIYLDIYPPPSAHRDNNGFVGTTNPHIVPALVYFHGGGLTVGNRKSWMPRWMQRRANAAGYAFISADYRLIPPATGHDIIDDIKDLFHFIREELNSKLNEALPLTGSGSFSRFHVDPNAIAVAGSSAGGQCATYAAMHVSPKPNAVVLMYAMGGDYLTPQYLIEKKVPFFRGREMLDRAKFTKYIHPSSEYLEMISSSPLAYHPPSSPTPGYPANERMVLARMYLQFGIMLDYITGEHADGKKPSLSDILRKSLASDKADLAHSGSEAHEAANERLKQLIPDRHLRLFPQFGITSDWPPTYLVHGSSDSAVLAHESRYMHKLLEKAGVETTLSMQEGLEHSFDYEPDAEAVHGSRLFDSIGEFLKEHLEKARWNAHVKQEFRAA